MSSFFQIRREEEQRAQVPPGPDANNGPDMPNPAFVPDPAPAMFHVGPDAPLAPGAQVEAEPEAASAPALGGS